MNKIYKILDKIYSPFCLNWVWQVHWRNWMINFSYFGIWLPKCGQTVFKKLLQLLLICSPARRQRRALGSTESCGLFRPRRWQLVLLLLFTVKHLSGMVFAHRHACFPWHTPCQLRWVCYSIILAFKNSIEISWNSQQINLRAVFSCCSFYEERLLEKSGNIAPCWFWKATIAPSHVGSIEEVTILTGIEKIKKNDREWDPVSNPDQLLTYLPVTTTVSDNENWWKLRQWSC